MKNITLAVPDDVYRAARIRAAERGTSVSALVADYLRGLSQAQPTFAQLEELQHRVQSEIGDFRASDRLARDEVHQRAVR